MGTTRTPRRPHHPRLVAGFALLFALAACGGPSADPEPVASPTTSVSPTATATPDPSPTPADDRALIARAEVPVVAVHASPDDAADVIHELPHPRPIGAPLTFLVDRQEGEWLEVLLPVRPNGSTGWIRADDVSFARTSYRVVVELSAHRMTVYERGEVKIETPIGVGGDGTPTPPGRYYVTELLRPPDPTGPYGPYAFGISGFSEVLLDFAGGEGVIGIHGTNDPSSIGRDASAGCVRVPNDIIREMATFLPLGAPVEIRA